MDQRLNELTRWVHKQVQALGLTIDQKTALSMVSGDASFRRYFRTHGFQEDRRQSFIVMDAPPVKESCDAFIHIDRAFEKQGLCVPHLFAIDREQGFLLLSDLGDELYLNHLTDDTVNTLYEMAMHALLQIQGCELLATQLPLYDERLLRTEMTLFNDWFCDRLLHLSMSEKESALVDHVFKLLIENSLAQPQVCVHRDYHSRNLMILKQDSPGILDFQDAVKGAITYDLVSLLKDCYIAWPRTQVEQWAIAFTEKLRQKQQLNNVSNEQFLRWFDWMGLQRHLKVLGIFSRLNLRDHKPRYLKDIPLVLNYVLDTTNRYDEFSAFHEWLQKIVKPRWQTFYNQEVVVS